MADKQIEKTEKRKKKETNKTKILAELEGNWIQHTKFDNDNIEMYDLFLIENLIMVSMSPEEFKNLRNLFKMLESKNNGTTYVS